MVTRRELEDGNLSVARHRLAALTPEQAHELAARRALGASRRDLVLAWDTALLAGLIVIDDLGPAKTRNFKRLMAEHGALDVLGVRYPRMQMLTVPEILAEDRFTTPSVAARSVVVPRLPET